MYSGLQLNIAFRKATKTSSNRSVFPNKSPGTRWEMFCKRVSKELIWVYLFSSYILQVGKKNVSNDFLVSYFVEHHTVSGYLWNLKKCHKKS